MESLELGAAGDAGMADAMSAQDVAMIAEGLGDCFLAFDAQWRIVLMNTAAEAYYDVRRETLIGRSVYDAFPAFKGSSAEPLWQTVMRDRRPVDRTVESTLFPGRVVRARIFPLSRGGGASLFQDVTRESLAADLTEDLRDSGDADTVLRVAAELVRSRLRAARTGYFEVLPDGERAAVRWAAGAADPSAPTIRLDDLGPTVRAELGEGQPVWSDEVANDARIEADGRLDAYLRAGIVAFAYVPFVQGGRLKGAFYVHFDHPFRWCEDHLRAVRGVAEMVWPAWERSEQALALQSSRERLRLALEASRMGEWVWDACTNLVDLSPRAAEIFGLAPGPRLTWEQVAELIHPDDLAAARAASQAAMGGRTYHVQYRITRPSDGRLVWIEARGRAIFDGAGEPVARLGVAQDVTEAKIAEEALRRSEERLRIALSAARMVAWEHDLTTRVTVRSDNAREVLGEPDAAGSYLPRIPPDDRIAVQAALERIGTTGQPMMLEHRFETPAGCRWMETRALLDRDAEGRPRRVIGVMRDIHEQRLARDLLRQANDSLAEQVEVESAERRRLEDDRQRFWDLSRDLFAVITHWNGRARLLNGAAWERVLGHPAEALKQVPFVELIHPEDVEQTLALAQQLEDQPVFGFENRCRHADGRWIWLSWNIIADGGANYAVARDVTEEKLREAHAQRAQKLEALGQLTGGVAHDFNNLLTAIIGALDMVGRRPEDAQLRARLIGAALAAARRGERLNKQLLGFARRHALKPEFLKLDGFLADMRPLLKGALGDAVRLDLRLEAGELGCRLDAAQLEAAVLNLIVNARDAMAPAGGVVALSTRPAEPAETARLGLGGRDFLVLAVADDGPGMAPEVLGRAFEPFFTTKQVGQGSGLGLSHVYGFARQSGGAADIESAPGQGATVRLYLPVAAEDPETAPLQARARPAAARPHEILLVEDDALVGLVTEDILSDLGHVVTRAQDGLQALELLKARSFDALVTDVRMPGGLNGVALAAEAVRRQPDLKVLLCSGWTEDALGEELKGARWPLLLKPFDAAQMQAALQAVLSS